MAFNVTQLEGNEIVDDYIKTPVQGGRWGDTWGVFKANLGKLVLINIFVLITFVPGIVALFYRGYYIAQLGLTYPFNPSVIYPLYPDVRGLTERMYLSTDIVFYALLIASGLVASLGLSGAAYSIRKLVATHGDFTFKTFFHGIKVGYLKTLIAVTCVAVTLYGTLLCYDWMNLVLAEGGNAAGAITAFVFAVIAATLICIYCGWLFAVGNAYRIKITQIFKYAFLFMVKTPLQTVIMSAFTLVPIWIFMIGGFMQFVAYVLFILLGFSFMLISWTTFAQWVFDLYVEPSAKPVEKQRPQKSEKELAIDKEDAEKRRVRELLAAGRSELIARPIKPIDAKCTIAVLGETFGRADLSILSDGKSKLSADVLAYEDAHKGEASYAEYNRLFADREKALPSSNGKKGGKKKVSSDNLLR